jgi:hypothetical protein
LRRRIRELSQLQWEVNNFSWVYIQNNLLPTTGSRAWQYIGKSWSQFRKYFVQLLPRSLDKARQISVWTPNQLMIDEKEAGCGTTWQRIIQAAGINLVGGIMKDNRQAVPWEERATYFPPRARRAYNKLVSNLDFSRIPGPENAAESQAEEYIDIFLT